jgi:hypothetical protein
MAEVTDHRGDAEARRAGGPRYARLDRATLGNTSLLTHVACVSWRHSIQRPAVGRLPTRRQALFLQSSLRASVVLRFLCYLRCLTARGSNVPRPQYLEG